MSAQGGSAMAVMQEEVRPALSAAGGVALVGIGARRLGVWFAVAGWASLVLMWITGSAGIFGHDQEGIPAIIAIGLFLLGWVVMVAAMMLPSSLSTLDRVDRSGAAAGRLAPPRVMVGYFLAWSVFGAMVFAGDLVVHVGVARISWLAERPSLIAGGVAMFAGVAEFLGRTPPPRFPSIAPGGGPFALGKAHAGDRIRRCWPLMLFAAAVGMSSPLWMVGLTLVKALELRPRASTALRLVGVALFAVGAAVILEPGWMPVLLGPA
jgi:predicted metal-binding membrane protein